MTRILQYVSLPAGRDQVIRNIGMAGVVGGTIVSAILLVAALVS